MTGIGDKALRCKVGETGVALLRLPVVGKIINLEGGAYRIVAVGQELYAISGGKDVFETTVEKVSNKVLTTKEIEEFK